MSEFHENGKNGINIIAASILGIFSGWIWPLADHGTGPRVKKCPARRNAKD